MSEVWSANCAQLRQFDSLMGSAEEEIKSLKRQLAEAQRAANNCSPASSVSTVSSHTVSPTPATGLTTKRSGKAPPIEWFSGDSYEVLFDDWLPSLERTAEWNGWSESDKLLQLAGHLKGKALQEWMLVDQKEKSSYVTATAALRSRLDTGGKILAAQDFRHLSQGDKETVAELVLRLERTFRIAYGRDNMSSETRDALLYSQLQEGLKQEIMKSPAVSGAANYKELCIAAKNEERRMASLKKREQYHKPGSNPRSDRQGGEPGQATTQTSSGSQLKQCFNCKKFGHILTECRANKQHNSKAKQASGASI